MKRLFWPSVLAILWPVAVLAQPNRLPNLHETLTFNHRGVERTYHLLLPTNPPSEMPLMIVLHGLGGHADKLRYGLGLNALAEDRGYAIAYPQGLGSDWGPHWNAGFPFTEVDDVGFLSALARHIQSEYGASVSETYAMGISIGGFMAYHLACQAAVTFRAVAVVIGSMSGEDWRSCTPAQHLSILHIHGTQDPLIRYNGAPHWANGWGDAGAVPDVVARWAARQAAQATAPAWDLPSSKVESYRNSTDGTEVTLVSMLGYGHDWPHRENSEISAAELIFDFFDRARIAHKAQYSQKDGKTIGANVVFDAGGVGLLWR